MKFFKKLYSYFYFQSWNLGLWTPPDRRFLKNQILPSYAENPDVKTVLFVGVRRYTRTYTKFFKRAQFITIDNDPAAERFGSRDHICADIRTLGQWQSRFPRGLDLVFLNGVIGFGLNDVASVEETIQLLARHLRPGGRLVLGVNPLKDSHISLDRLESLRANFSPVGLTNEAPDRYTFSFPLLPGARHEYRFFARRSNLAAV